MRKLQTNLTRIFIVLESESHGLSENWDGISRKFNRWSTKKKVFTEIETDFSGKIGNSNAFPAQKQMISKKKKGLHRNWDGFFGQKRIFKRFFRPNHDIYFTTSAPNFLWGGAVFIFSPKIGLKSTKNVRFCILQRLEPPLPPLRLRYWFDWRRRPNRKSHAMTSSNFFEKMRDFLWNEDTVEWRIRSRDLGWHETLISLEGRTWSKT